jgi:hypothetical protein
VIVGLAVGLIVVAMQAAAILALAPRLPQKLWVAVVFALPLIGLFVLALLLLDDADRQLGLVTAQAALVLLGPDLAEARDAPPPDPEVVRHSGWLLISVQALCLALAAYSALVLDDLQAAAPVVLTLLGLERCRRYVRGLSQFRR